jgi:hypothetical protein
MRLTRLQKIEETAKGLTYRQLMTRYSHSQSDLEDSREAYGQLMSRNYELQQRLAEIHGLSKDREEE